MALKPDRIELPDGSRIKYFMNEIAEQGVVLILDSPGGEGMDNPEASVSLPAGATGVPAGVLMNDVVNLNLTRQHLNQHQDEVQKGGKVTLLRHGVIVTDMINTGVALTVGQEAYYDAVGYFTNTPTADNGKDNNLSNQVGRFLSIEDADGYAKIEVDIN